MSDDNVSELVPRVMFVDELPPVWTGRPSTTDPYVEALKARPGVWALVHRRTKGTPNAFGGRAGALKKRGCQTAQRTVGDELHLYARWPLATTGVRTPAFVDGLGGE